MIEDLIETGQYKEALQYLNDMDNEQVRYQRLVCLYGLKELQQAKREGMKAKVLAGETYYDVVAIYVSILKDLEEFEEAINIIVEELSMPYIPYQYETVFNAAYDELLLAKQEASFDGVTQKVFNEEDIENILTKKDAFAGRASGQPGPGKYPPAGTKSSNALGAGPGAYGCNARRGFRMALGHPGAGVPRGTAGGGRGTAGDF